MINKERLEMARNSPILEVADRLGLELIKIGRRSQCLCVFHSENTPSLTFFEDTNSFFCFGCNRAGDSLDLIMQKNACNLKEAMDFVLGTDAVASQCYSPRKETKKNLDGLEFSDIYKTLIDLLPFPDENHYLVTDRKLNPDVLKQNDIKAVLLDKTWEYKDKLLKLFSLEKLLKSQILQLSDNNKPYLFFFKYKAIVPFYNELERIFFLQGLTDQKPKVLNLKNIKKPSFYFPKELKPDTKEVLVVEGVIDALSAQTIGYPAICVIDAGVRNFGEIDRLKDESFLLVGDFDSAGLDLKIRLFRYLAEKGFKVASSSVNSFAERLRGIGLIGNEEATSVKDFNDLLKIIKKGKK